MATKKKLLEAAAGALVTPDTGDPEFPNVVLLLDGDGTSEDNNNTFTDSSTNGFTVTENGDVVQGSFSPYGDNWSNSFDGNSDYISIADSTDFDFGTGDFTMEAWVYPAAFTGNYNQNNIISAHEGTDNTAYSFAVYSDGKLQLYGGGGNNDYSTSTVSLNEWTHVMVTRSSGTVRFFINGTLDASTYTRTGNYNCTTQGLAIGKQPIDNGGAGATRYWNGWLSNARMVKGTALQTSSFTPSTSPLTNVTNTVLLACQSNRFIDNSSSSHTLTPAGTASVTPFSPFKNDDARDITTDGGSGYFDGTDGDSENHLDLGAARIPASGDFTFETWIKVSPKAGNQAICSQYANSQSGRMIFFVRSSTGTTPNVISLSISFISVFGTTVVADDAWHHVALERSGNNWYLYVDGALDNSGTSSGSIYTGINTRIGHNRNTAGQDNPLKGYLSDCRLTTSAVYGGSSYTVPTAPVSAITNTSILLNFQDAGIYDRSGINNLDTVGNARLGFAPIYGTGSLAFDGTGDYLETPFDDVYAFGTGDFTVEGWINMSTVPTGSYNAPLVGFGGANSSNLHSWVVSYYANSGQLILYRYDGTTETLLGRSWTPNANQWYHIAVCRSGTDLRLFVDGVQLGATFTSSLDYSSTITQGLVVGLMRTGASGSTYSYLDGYVDDVRITKGIARYTSDFTPPTEIDISLDTHAEYVTLFLDGDGTANGQNNTFTDSSTNGFTVTETGSVTQGVFSPYGDNWSNYFDGSDDYLELSGVTNEFDFGSDDWTMECWVSLQDGTGGIIEIYKDDNNYIRLFRDSGPDIQLRGVSGGSDQFKIQSSAQSKNVWIHIAGVRDGSTIRLFVDGTQVGTDTSFSIPTLSSPRVTVGLDLAATDRYFKGYISNARVVKGTAVYTSAFTPPTSPLTAIANTQLLACQSNRFIDESTNNFTLTVNSIPKVTRFSPFESNKPYDITTDGGSANFDSNEYLTIADNFSLDVSGAMTAEIWVYFTDMPDANIGSSGSGYLLNRWTASGSQRSWGIFVGANGAVAFYVSSSGGSSYTISSAAAGSVGLYRWHHVAVSWDGSNQRLFIDGDLKVTTANASGPFSTSSAGVTVNSLNVSTTGTNMNAYYSDARYFADAALYTSSFTPPTSPLTATSGSDTATVLLNFQDSAIPDLSGLNNIDTVGNAKVSSTDPTKYGSNAMRFDGSDDYLLIKYQAEDFWNLNDTDFTLEFWAYASSLGSFNAVLSSWEPTTAWLIESVGSDMRFYYNAGSTVQVSMGSISAGAWNHWAVTREGTTLRTFKDGTLVTSTTQSVMTANTNPLIVGAVWEASTSSSGQWNGYVDDLRITKGIARYTASFTPPDAALPKF